MQSAIKANRVSSVEALCNRLKSSRLLPGQQVRSLYLQWKRQQPQKSSQDVERFSKWLVAGHHVTAYQAQQLQFGLTDHLFLNHYRLIDLIGQGRMAGIYKASHILGHLVAIKVMPAANSRDREMLGRFKREGKMAARLLHPNVVRTYHLGKSAGRYYLVMEFLQGETLEDVLQRRKKMSYQEGVRLIHHALLGLQHVYEAGLVHRDINPSNLMLVPLPPPGAPDNTFQATLKILDIGLGRILFSESLQKGSSLLDLTTEGSMLGTPHYMAPEQARNAHEVDVRADIYSLGCVLYHLLTGQPPFTDPSPVMLILNHASKPPRPIRELEPSVPKRLEQVIETMLAKDRNRRFRTPKEVAHALQPFVSEMRQQLPSESALGQSYLKWVENQPLEEKSAAPATTDRWHCRYEGKTYGPLTSSQLEKMAQTGQLQPEDQIWMDGDDPNLAIQARAAVTFPAGGQRKARPTQTTPAHVDTGFDPNTGQIHDAAKFRQWQKQQMAKKAAQQATQPTIQEVFIRARMDLSKWVDLDRNRPLIVTGDMESIREDAAIQKFMLLHKRYGQELLHKLWQHLEFMIENRRKYYYAFGG